MFEESSDQPVKITAAQRAHPAIRAIARACIAFARWQRDNNENQPASSAEPVDKSPTSSGDRSEEAGDA